jgi:hypothetical protein
MITVMCTVISTIGTILYMERFYLSARVKYGKTMNRYHTLDSICIVLVLYRIHYLHQTSIQAIVFLIEQREILRFLEMCPSDFF